jgi:hypothetical protein
VPQVLERRDVGEARQDKMHALAQRELLQQMTEQDRSGRSFVRPVNSARAAVHWHSRVGTDM